MTSGTPRAAFDQPFTHEPASIEKPMLEKCLQGIFRTGRKKSTWLSDKRAQA